ncbi:MAG: hypothetical protein ACXVQU_03770 [Actinomycetota bacterium]
MSGLLPARSGHKTLAAPAPAREEVGMYPQPMDVGLRDFLNDLAEVHGDRHLHLEAQDGRLVAVSDTPGTDPVPVEWDDDLHRYQVLDSA